MLRTVKILKSFKQKCSPNIVRSISASCIRCQITKRVLQDGPNLKEFIQSQEVHLEPTEDISVPYYSSAATQGNKRKVYFDVYGCQMNVNDTEIIWAILKNNGFLKTEDLSEADVALVVTCAIREGAEAKIWHRIKQINAVRRKRGKDKPQMKIGILGCMAERLKHQILEKDKSVDLVAGPDAYKDLPRLLALTENNQTAVNVLLSLDETYADVMPVRLNENSVSAFVSIMRGCDNMCTYCIVPFTRGRERSRPVSSILKEVEQLAKQGVKEVTLLGQNVNSYRDLSETSESSDKPTSMAKGFKTVYKSKIGGLRFADLLEKVAEIDPEIRIRFTSPHPKDFPDEVLDVIRSKPNICKNLHLPAQSGNSAVLERMRRGYTREAYLDLVDHVRKVIPSVYLSSDFICGFCDETEEEFNDTLTLLDSVKYNMAYLFAYSMREKTTAHRRYKDNVPHEIKIERVKRMAQIFRRHAETLNKAQIDKMQLILVEGFSKKSKEQLMGRNDGNLKVVIPKIDAPTIGTQVLKSIKPGDYVVVRITEATSQGLKGIPLYHSTLVEFSKKTENPLKMLTEDYVKYNSML